MIFEIITILIATITTWYASKILAKGTEGLGNRYNISSSVKGATLDAVGSSFPEFCTVVFAIIAGSFEAGLGAIIGSALFNILIIPALCVIVSKDMKINKEVVYRDGFIYIITIIDFSKLYAITSEIKWHYLTIAALLMFLQTFIKSKRCPIWAILLKKRKT